MAKYWIDFSSWLIEADSELKAVEKTISLLKGKMPAICSTEKTDTIADEMIEYEEE